MSTPTGTPTPTSPTPAISRQGPFWRRRRAFAAVAAGALLVTVVGVSAPTVTTASSQQATTGFQPGYGRGWDSAGPGAYGSGSSSNSGSTVDSQAATATESQGVALIDTVLANGEAAGTGIVLTSDGQVLTNYHVVEGSTSIKVTIASTGTTYTATVVGDDSTADVALLQLKDASGLTTATIDDDTLAVGDDVTAVGNAGGTGTLSAADGTVTTLSTQVTTAAENGDAGESLTGLIQTDADVVAGDSGGPLIDTEGEVVGIDTAASTGVQIDGYAIPIDDALVIVAQIRTGTETTAVRIGASAFLGVQVSDTGYSDGAYVSGVVEDAAAADAGLSAGDTVTAVGSTNVSSASDLTTALAKRNPGDRVTITWTTASGSEQSATVTLGSSPVN